MFALKFVEYKVNIFLIPVKMHLVSQHISQAAEVLIFTSISNLFIGK